MGVQYDKICALLTETVMLMCKNGVQFSDELKVQGLIGLTADKEVHIIQINEVVKADPTNKTSKTESAEIAHSSSNSHQRDSNNQDNFVQNLSAPSSQKQIEAGDLQVVEKENLIKNDHFNTSHKNHNINSIVKKIYSVNSFTKVDTLVNTSSIRMAQTTTTDLSSNDNNRSYEVDYSVNINSNGDDQLIQNEVTKYFDDESFNNHVQDYPIDLHINNNSSNDNDNTDNNLHNNNENNNNILFDVKPSAGELEEWAYNNEYVVPSVHKKKRQSRGGVKAKKAKIKISSGSKNNTSNTLTNNNDTGNNSNNNTWELGMEGLPTGSQEDYNADLNNNSMLSNTSKYYCNLCTSSYKHFCNLLTHEVKVHGRQKKRGGRKRKSDALVVYDADNKAPTGDNNHSLGGAEEFDGGGGYGNETIDNEEVEGCSEEVMKGGAEGVLVEEA